MTADQLSIGGLVVGLGVLVATCVWWWIRESHNYKLIVPFIGAAGVGALWTACAGGLLGGAGGAVAGGANTVGGTALSSGTGTDAGMVAAAHMTPLTPGGAVVTVVTTAVWLLMLLKISGKAARLKLTTGVIVGASLTLTPLIAGWADSTVITAANSLGDWLVTGFEGWGA